MKTTHLSLAVSIVVFKQDMAVFRQALASLFEAIESYNDRDSGFFVHVFIVDNNCRGPLNEEVKGWLSDYNNSHCKVEVIFGHGNVGYGRGHNIAIRNSVGLEYTYHLIMNSDVVLDRDALSVSLEYMEKNSEVSAVSPFALDGVGNKQYLCKKYPTLCDLFLRGYGPLWLKRRYDDRLSEYEHRDLPEFEPTKGISIISGCFMLCRRKLLEDLGGFDESFFLYFEDFDLSLRASVIGPLAYLPSMKIRHFGGGAAKKGLRHSMYFVVSGVKFFNKHGWAWSRR